MVEIFPGKRGGHVHIEVAEIDVEALNHLDDIAGASAGLDGHDEERLHRARRGGPGEVQMGRHKLGGEPVHMRRIETFRVVAVTHEAVRHLLHLRFQPAELDIVEEYFAGRAHRDGEIAVVPDGFGPEAYRIIVPLWPDGFRSQRRDIHHVDVRSAAGTVAVDICFHADGGGDRFAACVETDRGGAVTGLVFHRHHKFRRDA